MRRIFLSLISLSLLSLQAASAQEPVSLSLEQAVDYALKHSVAARNARIDVELQKAQNREVTGRTLPQIAADGKYTQFFDVQQAFLPSQFAGLPPGDWVPLAFSPKLSSVGQVNANQILFNGSIFVALQARNTLMELARLNANMKEEDVRYNVRKAYVGLQIAHRQQDLMAASLELVRSATHDLEVTYANGLVEKIELTRMQVQLSNLQADSINLSGLIEVSEKMLKYTLGMDLNTPIRLTDGDKLDNIESVSLLLTRESAYDQVLTYQLAKTGLKIQEYDLKRYRFEGLPSLVAFGGMGYNRASSNFSDLVNKPYPGFSFAGLQLTIPIFDGMQRRSRVHAAKLKVEKAKNDFENAKLGIDVQTKSARTKLMSALQTVESRKRTMELANSVLDLSKRKYKLGVGSNQDVVLAQRDWLEAQNNYFAALQSVYDAQADLQKALGMLQ